MVAAGLIGGLAVGVGTLIQSQTKTQKGIEARFRGDLLYADIMATLADGDACLSTFGGMNPTNAAAVSVASVKDATGNVKYTTGVDYQDRTVQISSMNFGGTTGGGWQTDGGGTYAGYATLVLNFTKIGNVAGASTFSRKFRVKVTLNNPANTVLTCTAASAMGSAGSLWSTNGSTVYYNSGNVGVNLTNPSAPLTIFGTINSMTTGVNFSDGINQATGSGIWVWNGPGKLYYPNIGWGPTGYGTGEGNVGIGLNNPRVKLEVLHNNPVRIDTTYLSGTNGLYGWIGSNAWFNGTAWQIPNGGAKGALLGMMESNIILYTNIQAGSAGFLGVFNGLTGYTSACAVRAGSASTAIPNPAYCNSTETTTGGGCISSGFIQMSWPAAGNGWACGASVDTSNYITTPYAICCY